MPERINLGKVLVTLEGEHDSTRSYDKYCEVTSGGSSFVSKKDVPIGTPITDTTYWQKRASKGADGINGVDGNNGEDAYQPFKGWYDTSSSLGTAFPTPQVGDYAYVVGASASDPVTIYKCSTAGTWSASSSTFNPANNQEFASGESLNTVNIVDNLNSSSATDVLSAKQGKELKSAVDALGPKIEQELYEDIRAYETISGKYIDSVNKWTSYGQSKCRYIEAKAGDVIHVEKNADRDAWIACIESVDTTINPVFKSGFTGCKKDIDDYTFTVSENCYFYWLIQYSNASIYAPSVLTLNGVDILESTYKIKKFDTINQSLQTINGQIEELSEEVEEASSAAAQITSTKRTVDNMLGEYREESTDAVDWGTKVQGKFWDIVNGVAALKSASNYYAREELLQVSPNSILIVTLPEAYWNIDNFGSVAALCAVDNDGLPAYPGGGRINWSSSTLQMDIVTNQDNSKTYTIHLGSNTTQVGLFYSNRIGQELTFYLKVEEGVTFSELLDQHINEVVSGDEVVSSVSSADYYLKGNSNIVIPSSKKIGIIAAGQSNIDGRNSYSDLPSGFVNPNPNVHFSNTSTGQFRDFSITDGGQNNDWSFDAIVYDLLVKSAYGNQSEIYVMKTSMGGTSIDKDGATDYHWTADYEKLDSVSHSLLRSFEANIRAARDAQGSNFEIRAFLWHQGEGDSSNEAVAKRYYTNLKNMLAYVRGIVGNPRLYFFCGNISLNRPSMNYVPTINAAYARLAAEDPYFKVVDMTNAQLEDSYHFNYQWSIYFGQKVYDLMIDAGIISGTKINPSEPS